MVIRELNAVLGEIDRLKNLVWSSGGSRRRECWICLGREVVRKLAVYMNGGGAVEGHGTIP